MKFLIFISLTLYLAPSYAESNTENYLFKFDIKSKVYESSDDPCKENSFLVKIIDQVKLECQEKGLSNCYNLKEEFIRYDTATTVSIFKRVDIDSYTYMYLPIPRTIVLGKACVKRIFVRQYSIPKVSEAPKVVSAPVGPLVCKEPIEPNCGLHRITANYGAYLFSDPMNNEMGTRLENGKWVGLGDNNIYKGFAGAEVIQIKGTENYKLGFIRLDQTDFPRSCFKTCEEALVAEKKIEVAPKSLAGSCEPLKKDCKIGRPKVIISNPIEPPYISIYGNPDGSDGVEIPAKGLGLIVQSGWELELADKNIYKDSLGRKMIKVKGLMDHEGNNFWKKTKGLDFAFLYLVDTDYSEQCFQTCHDGSVTANIKNIDNSNRGTTKMKSDNKKANDSNKVKKSNAISK